MQVLIKLIRVTTNNLGSNSLLLYDFFFLINTSEIIKRKISLYIKRYFRNIINININIQEKKKLYLVYNIT